MSDHIAPANTPVSAARSRRGQTLVEFALTLPMLIVLLLGIADFARVFQAGIVTEAAARDAAEVAAIERLRTKPPTVSTQQDAYYQHLHDIAAQAACSESRDLENATHIPDDPGTTMPDDDICPTWPIIAVCVHDGVDPHCGQTARGYVGAVPTECSEIVRPWDPTSPGAVASHSVEVRMCYRFTTLLNLNFSMPLGWGLSLGDVYLQKTRTFVVDCVPAADISGC